MVVVFYVEANLKSVMLFVSVSKAIFRLLPWLNKKPSFSVVILCLELRRVVVDYIDSH